MTQKNNVINDANNVDLINAHFKLKALNNLDSKEILEYYNDENDNNINLADIYYYLFNKENSDNKYSPNFIAKYGKKRI